MTKDNVRRLIDHLQGSCMSLYEAANDLDLDEDDLTSEDYDQIDNQIARCDSCSWWVEMVDEEGNCSDCAEEG